MICTARHCAEHTDLLIKASRDPWADTETAKQDAKEAMGLLQLAHHINHRKTGLLPMEPQLPRYKRS